MIYETCFFCGIEVELGEWMYGQHFMENAKLWINDEPKVICKKCQIKTRYIRHRLYKMGLSKSEVRENHEYVIAELLRFKTKELLKKIKNENIKTS